MPWYIVNEEQRWIPDGEFVPPGAVLMDPQPPAPGTGGGGTGEVPPHRGVVPGRTARSMGAMPVNRDNWSVLNPWQRAELVRRERGPAPQPPASGGGGGGGGGGAPPAPAPGTIGGVFRIPTPNPGDGPGGLPEPRDPPPGIPPPGGIAPPLDNGGRTGGVPVGGPVSPFDPLPTPGPGKDYGSIPHPLPPPPVPPPPTGPPAGGGGGDRPPTHPLLIQPGFVPYVDPYLNLQPSPAQQSGLFTIGPSKSKLFGL